MASTPFPKALERVAVLAGSFLSGIQTLGYCNGFLLLISLSGSMVTISILSIPVALETTTGPSHLLYQWTRMFYYGHRLHPTIAFLTSTLYGYCAWRRRAASRSWTALAWAGLVTMSISPFTWLFLLPTNSAITDLASRGHQGAVVIGIDDARRLVVRWSWLHLVRSLFPLLGGVIAMNEAL